MSVLPGASQKTASFALLAFLAGVALYGCYQLVTPFLTPLAWAVAFAVVGNPLHRFVEARVGNPHLAAALSVGVVSGILILPAVVASDQLLKQAMLGVDFWTQQDPLRRFPILNHLDFKGHLSELARQLPAFLKGSVGAMTQLPVAMFCLFFFFRDRRMIIEYANSWLPLSEEEVKELTTRISDILHATIFGRIMLASIQGALGGVMFLWLGLPTPLLWGLIMSFLALIPFVGASLVWAPAAAYLFFSGSVGKALVLAAWGLLVVSTVDNALYPFLVGARMQLHPLATFLGVLGGISWLGPSGLILGPVILATASALLEVCRRRVKSLVMESEPLQPEAAVASGSATELVATHPASAATEGNLEEVNPAL